MLGILQHLASFWEDEDGFQLNLVEFFSDQHWCTDGASLSLKCPWRGSHKAEKFACS